MPTVTLDEVREALTLTNEHRKAQNLLPMQMFQGVEPKGLTFMVMTHEGMRPSHSGAFNRKEALCFLHGQLEVLGTLGG